MRSMIKQLVVKLVSNPMLAKIEKKVLDSYEAVMKEQETVVEPKKGEEKVTEVKI